MLCVVRAYSLYSCGCCPWAIGKYRRRTKVLFLQCDFLYRFSHLHLTHPGSGTTFSGSRCPSLFLMRSCRHRQTLSARQLPDQPPVHFFFSELQAKHNGQLVFFIRVYVFVFIKDCFCSRYCKIYTCQSGRPVPSSFWIAATVLVILWSHQQHSPNSFSIRFPNPALRSP